MKRDYLFVYGTLRRDVECRMSEIVQKYCDFIGQGYIYGRLYNIVEYPGVVASDKSSERVYGDIYKVKSPEEAFSLFDDYEECTDKYPEPHEYIRLKQRVYLTNGETIDCWVYIYNFCVRDLELVESGDYLKYISSKEGD